MTSPASPSTRAGWRWIRSRTTSRPGRSSRNRHAMPEPTGTAKLAGEILSGVYRFTMHDDRIDSQSDGYAIIEKGKAILIDPLPMTKKDRKQLGLVEAICLIGSCHERSAWGYRRGVRVLVYAPQGGVGFEGSEDHG